MKQFYQRDLASGTIYLHSSLLGNCEKLTLVEGKRLHQLQAKTALLKLLTQGQTVYTVLKHVSASGMSRRISCLIVHNDRIENVDHYVETLLDWKRSDKGGIIVSGCGMDMGFHLAYTLSSVLFRVEGEPRADRAGYELEHVWL